MKTKVDGIHLAYELSGKNTPPLLLMHGFGLNRSIWHELVEQHLGNQQVILPDLRWHGDSAVPPGPYAMTLMAQDIADLLESLAIDQAILCGHSMGGYVALAFAEQFPDKLAGLGLITTNAVADSPEKRAGRYALINDIQARGSLAVAENLAPRLSSNPAVVTQAYALISQCNPTGLIGSLQAMAERADKTALLKQIKVPALVVAGEDDQITNFTGAQAMAQSLPEGEFIGIPGVGHMLMLEDPVTLGYALRSLINRVNENNTN